jgi:hypothetical protein
MQYGEPFTHTGVLTHYNVDKNIVFMSGAITGSGTGGWDGNFNRNMSNWGGIGGVTYTTDDKRSSLNIAGTGSEQSARNSAFWGMYSVVAKHMITPKTHFILQHDHGYADNITVNGMTQQAHCTISRSVFVESGSVMHRVSVLPIQVELLQLLAPITAALQFMGHRTWHLACLLIIMRSLLVQTGSRQKD